MKKIDTSTIEGYADMTLEEKVAALEAFEYEDNLSEIERYKNAASKANSEAAEWRKKHNALLSEDEAKKLAEEEEINTLKQQVAEFKKEKLVAEHKAHYVSLGYDEDLAGETALALVDNDTDKVFANQKRFLETHDKKYKAQLMGENSTPPAGQSGDPIKKDYSALIEDAYKSGNIDAAAYYTRIQQMENKT